METENEDILMGITKSTTLTINKKDTKDGFLESYTETISFSLDSRRLKLEHIVTFTNEKFPWEN